MSVFDKIKNGDRVSFSLIRPGIAGDSYTNVLVDTIAGYGTAKFVTPDIAVKHANLYPFFKDEVDGVNNPGSYQYLIIKPNDLTDVYVAIGIPWINESSVKVGGTSNVSLELYNFEEYKRPALVTFLENANIQYSFSDK